MKTTRLLLAVLLLALPAFGQSISGNITTSSTDCSIGAACLSLPLPTNAGAATIQVAGTYTGTLQFELTSDAKGCLAASTSFVNVSASPLPSGAAVSSTTSTGTWRANSAGGTCLRVRASAFASGSASVTMNYGTGSASTGAGGGAATTFDTLASGTNTSAAMVVGTGASLATSGSGTIAATSLAGLTGTLHQVPIGSGGGLADSTGLSESYPTFTVNESQTTNGTQAVIGDVTTTQLTAPSTLACVQGASTGGFLLHNQAYFYKVTAISANGQTTVSNESTFTTAASPVGDTYTANCTWTGHTGDTGYKLYRSTTTNTETLLATITPGNTNAYTDNTNTVPSGAMPTTNTTGSATVNSALGIGIAPSLAKYQTVDANSGLYDFLVTFDNANNRRTGIKTQFDGGVAANNLLQFLVSDTTVTGTVAPLTLKGDSTAVFGGVISAPNNKAVLTADWTMGTGGTVTNAGPNIVGATATPLTFTLPLVAASWRWECNLVVGQATAATANTWSVLTATNGATNVTAAYQMNTAATAMAGGAVTDQASTTSAFAITPNWTLGGTNTKMPVRIWGSVEGASASGTVLSLELTSGAVADLITIYRGSECHIQ